MNDSKIMKQRFIEFLATILPDFCPFSRTFDFKLFKITIPPLCTLNPFYQDIMKVKLKRLGYDLE